MAKHTPGPWTDRNGDGEVDGYVWAGDTVICGLGDKARQRADARLIAAAPDLLYALKAMLKHYDYSRVKGWSPSSAALRAQAAVAKAEGRQP
jgi:hypothetical protein